MMLVYLLPNGAPFMEPDSISPIEVVAIPVAGVDHALLCQPLPFIVVAAYASEGCV